uniref:Uncharacterized protein n=1 Tax=Siphoviridae sp. ctm7X10 TaxID=2827929 RepID=A0A8S5S619_9CAUD|nr:MAG TPA: hypothetical protein [Siphoviridae sp. ctm7X10]
MQKKCPLRASCFSTFLVQPSLGIIIFLSRDKSLI